MFINFKTKIIKNAIMTISFITFITTLILFYQNKLVLIDNYVYDKLYFCNYITTFFKIITQFGSGIILILITIFLYIILKNKKYSIFIFLNLICSFIINYVLKMIFRRPRPLDINLIIEDGYSFPSGHTTVSTAFYVLIIYLIYKSNINKNIKLVLVLLLFLLITLIGISRIYLGVHHATDVIASYSIASIYILLYINIIKDKCK